MNNTTLGSPCILSSSFQATRSTLQLVTYNVITPMYFLFGTSIHVIYLRFVWAQSKKETAYAYQIFVVLCELCENILVTLYTFSFFWCSESSAVYGNWLQWCVQSSGVRWYAFHVSFPLVNAFNVTRLLLTVCMSLDRLYGLLKPVDYRVSHYHKVRQGLSLVICATVGLSTSAFDAFRYNMKPDIVDQKERYALNTQFINSSLATFLLHLRDVVRIVALIALIICNVCIIKQYRKKVLDGKATEENNYLTRAKKENETTLTILAVSLSVFGSVETVLLTSYYTVTYLAPDFTNCQGKMMTPILDMICQVMGTAKRYLVLVVSKTLRRQLFRKHGAIEDTAGARGALEMKTHTTRKEIGATEIRQ